MGGCLARRQVQYDMDLPNIVHAFQTAEGLRAMKLPDWLQLTGLIHDLGKMIYLRGCDEDGTSMETQWAIVGDTWIVGCAVPEQAPSSRDLPPSSRDLPPPRRSRSRPPLPDGSSAPPEPSLLRRSAIAPRTRRSSPSSTRAAPTPRTRSAARPPASTSRAAVEIGQCSCHPYLRQ